MDKKLLEILACPSCKSSLVYVQEEQELVCIPCRLAYTVRDDIPIMLIISFPAIFNSGLPGSRDEP